MPNLSRVIDYKWTSVADYGAVGDGLTDDTAALQAASTAASGKVYFPHGIYAISDTLALKSNTEYTGPLGGTFPTSNDHPQAGYGAALKWIGAPNGVMVKAMDVRSTNWRGIDLDGVDRANGVIGIHHYSDNSPISESCKFSNLSGYNLDHGMVVGGLASEATHTYQCDGWEITNFAFYLVNTGILVNGGNASQFSHIHQGWVGYFEKGIYIKEGSYLRIADIAFGNRASPHTGSGNIVLGLPRVVTIQNCQGEPWAPATTDYFLHGLAGNSTDPITLIGNYADGGVLFDAASSARNVVSLGNHYSSNIDVQQSDLTLSSISDWHASGAAILDSGVNNIILEENAYYVDSGPLAYRRRFNQAVIGYHSLTASEIKSGWLTLTVNSATPSVLNASSLMTFNTNPTTITDFLNGVEDQVITILFFDALTTIQHNGTTIFLNGSTNFVSSVGSTLTLVKTVAVGSFWFEVSRSKV